MRQLPTMTNAYRPRAPAPRPRPKLLALARRLGDLTRLPDERLDALLGDRARVALIAAVDLTARVAGLRTCRPERVAAVFPHLSTFESLAVAAASERHAAVRSFVRRTCQLWGDAWLARAVEVRGQHVLAALRDRPLLVVAWHAGIASVLPAGLAQCGRDGVVLLHDGGHDGPRHGFAPVATSRHPQQRALALMTATQALRNRKAVVVFAGIDKHTLAGSHPTTPFLGRVAFIAPGVAILARLSGAALVPAQCRLERGRIVVEVFEPLPTGPDDHDTTRRLAGFFEPRIAADPGSLWRDNLDRLWRTPRLAR